MCLKRITNASVAKTEPVDQIQISNSTEVKEVVKREEESVKEEKDKPIPPNSNHNEDSLSHLETITNHNMIMFQKNLCPPGGKCMFIVSICVVPRHQHKGVGRALMRWGTEQADRKGEYCWVHSSETGVNAFRKEGFEDIETLMVNLDDYTNVPPPMTVGRWEEGKWGMYTWTGMKRDARRAVKT